MIKNSKQRAYLKGLAMNMTPIIQIGKSSVTPELTQAVEEALEARELIKISVLQNCLDDPRQMAEVLAERTHADVVQVIGKKIVLYKEGSAEKKEEPARNLESRTRNFLPELPFESAEAFGKARRESPFDGRSRKSKRLGCRF